MQADTGLVQNINHPDQTGPNLCRQTDTLRFAAGKCSGRAGQRQIVQTDINQKSQPCTDFFDHLRANQLLLGRQGQVFHKFIQVIDRIIRDFTDISAAYGHGEGLFLQSLSAALITRRDGHETLILLAAPLGSGLSVTALYILDQAFKRNIVYTNASLSLVMYLHLTASFSVNQQVLNLLRVLPERRIQAEMVLSRQCFQHLV